MNTWDEDECNTYVGTDSTIFPALMNKNDGLSFYLHCFRIENTFENLFMQEFLRMNHRFVVHLAHHLNQRPSTMEFQY